MRLWCSGLLLIATLALSQTTAPQPVPRTILVLFDGTFGDEIKFHPVHEVVEMPLNHLGLVVTYWDIRTGLPSLDRLKHVRGILTWFRGDATADPIGLLQWCEAAVDAGKKMVIIGDLSVSRDLKNKVTPLAPMNRVWGKIGLQSTDNWVGITYDWKVAFKDSRMVEFEGPLPRTLPAFIGIKRIDPTAKSYLTVRRGNDPASDNDLVVISKNGGYVSSYFVNYSTSIELHNRRWYINPFEFFRLAFETDDLPKADATTLVGRRIFYSHVDGDGWRNVTQVMPYKTERKLAPYVVLKDVIEAFPDFPITIGPIAGDIDPAWHGTPESLQLARDILARRNVEAGSHTYAHPLEWGVFVNYKPAPAGAGKAPPTLAQRLLNLGRGASENAPVLTAKPGSRYEQPISYTDQPFDLNREIRGAADFINGILPAGKRVQILQWSGNALPFEAAIEASRKAGLRNINGGDTRMDPEYPSYAWVSPVGLQAGSQRQIYASASNENTYTHLWTDRFFGFQFLTRTVQNTNTPIRLKPHNIYFHMYSAENLPGVTAVVENFKYARAQELAPVTASRYAAAADGFYSTKLTAAGGSAWKVEDRDGLQTIRFDRSTLQAVDFGRSSGVLGQRRFQGSLYVALDPADAAPIVALRAARTVEEFPAADTAYLVESRWEISGLKRIGKSFSFESWGYGAGDATWHVPAAGNYAVSVRTANGTTAQSTVEAGSNLLLKLKLGPNGIDKVQVTVSPARQEPQ